MIGSRLRPKEIAPGIDEMGTPANSQGFSATAMTGRYRILAALWLFQTVNYIDRVSMSFAGPSISKALRLGPAEFGIVLSSFAVGYTVGQLPGGILADRRGVWWVLLSAPLAWAAFMGFHALVSGLIGFIIVRGGLGFAEGFSNPACFKTIGLAFSSRERARASAWWATSVAVAPAIAAPLIVGLTVSLGWRAMFLCLMPLALITAVVNGVVIPKQSETNCRNPDAAIERPTKFALVFRQPSFWMLMAAYFAYNIGYWGYVGWMPTYLVSAHGIDIKKLGLLGSVPYLFGVVGLLLNGWLGSGPLYRYRPHLLAATYLLAACGLTAAISANTLFMTMVGLSGAAFALFGGLALFGAIVLELAPTGHSGAYTGAVTTAGQLGGILAPALIGQLVAQSGAFGGGFALMIGAFLVAAICMLGLVPYSDRLYR